MTAASPMTVTCPLYAPLAPARAGGRALRAGYDAARSSNETRNHWREADALAPVSQMTPDVRKKLRDRSRYECLNNTYAAGVVRTLVNDTVGRGPRLEVQTDDGGLNRAVQDLWREWAAAADWALTCRILAGVRYVAGECFGIFHDSKRLDRLGLAVTLDLRLVEPDQVAHPWGGAWFNNPTGDDGVICDADGDVVAYRVLRAHPGDQRQFAPQGAFVDVAAEDVLHWFEPQRPGQLRGVTPLHPALPIFAQLRRYTAATLTAAEIAALLAGVMTLPGVAGAESDEFEAKDTISLVRGMLLTLPAGASVTQFKPEQPMARYVEFVNAKLKEAGRCLNMPFGKMAGDYTTHTYSGGRLEDGLYWGDRDVERQALEAKAFNPFVRRWLNFARFALPALAAYRGDPTRIKFRWHYDPRPTADPVKDGTGDEINMTNGTVQYSDILAQEGTTLDEALDQRKRDVEAFTARGLPLPPCLSGAPVPPRMGDGIPQNPADVKGELFAPIHSTLYVGATE